MPPRAVATYDITVLLGGPGPEREVSLNSGAAVAAALTRLGHRVTPADVSPSDLSALDRPADLVFIALHGQFGEDGQLQAILEQRGMPFVGSGSEASKLAMDKAAAKERFGRCHIPTPPFSVVTAEGVNNAMHCWQLPAVIKPLDAGSSVDTYIVKDVHQFRDVIGRMISKYGRLLIEQFIHGPELTVGILGDRALPVCEIRTPREFYDYVAKYHDDQTEYLFESQLPAELLRSIQHMSLQAHGALGCRDFSRVDWMVDAETHQPYLLEVNTIPGFTDHSLLPKAASRSGFDFDQMCQRIIELAMARHR